MRRWTERAGRSRIDGTLQTESHYGSAAERLRAAFPPLSTPRRDDPIERGTSRPISNSYGDLRAPPRSCGTASFRREMAEAWERGRTTIYELGYRPNTRLRYDRREGEVTLITNGVAFESLVKAVAWARAHPDYQRQQREKAARRYPLGPDPNSGETSRTESSSASWYGSGYRWFRAAGRRNPRLTSGSRCPGIGQSSANVASARRGAEA